MKVNKIRLWCTKHDKPLFNFEQSNLIFVQTLEPGIRQLDLSDFACPDEMDSASNVVDQCVDSWQVTLVP